MAFSGLISLITLSNFVYLLGTLRRLLVSESVYCHVRTSVERLRVLCKGVRAMEKAGVFLGEDTSS